MYINYFLKRVAPFILVMLIGGCATMGDVLKAKQDGSEGTSRVYPVSTSEAWKISKTVLRWEGADAIEENHEKGYMLTSSGANFVTMGTLMGVWVEPIDKNRTLVTIITKRKMQTNLFTTLTESTFHQRFQQALSILKSGKPLPLVPPAPPSPSAYE